MRHTLILYNSRFVCEVRTIMFNVPHPISYVAVCYRYVGKEVL